MLCFETCISKININDKENRAWMFWIYSTKVLLIHLILDSCVKSIFFAAVYPASKILWPYFFQHDYKSIILDWIFSSIMLSVFDGSIKLLSFL